MDEIKKESHGLKRNVKRYLPYLIVMLSVIVLSKGFFLVEEQVSREVYQLCILLFVVVWGLGLLVISKRKGIIGNKN
jgi:hypothetical protein